MLADSIMAQQEELDLRQRQREEQQRWEQQEGESESESEDGENEETAGRQGGAAAGEQRQAAAAAPAAAPQQGEAGSDRGGGEQQEEGGAGGAEEEGPAYIRISEAEQQENSTAFLDAMRQRFLSGQDAGVDYAAIDAGAPGVVLRVQRQQALWGATAAAVPALCHALCCTNGLLTFRPLTSPPTSHRRR